MPSRIRRRSAAGTWVDVADFDNLALAPNTAWGCWKRGTFVVNGYHDVPAAGQPDAVQDVATMTTTLVSGRLYRLTIHVRAVAPADGSGAVAHYWRIRKDGVVVVALGDPWVRSMDNYDSFTVEFVFPADVIGTTSNTVLSAQVSNGNPDVLRLWLDAASYYMIEDIGPDRG